MLYCSVLGKGLLPSLDYAAERLVTPGARVVPAAIQVKRFCVLLCIAKTFACCQCVVGDEQVHDLSNLSTDDVNRCNNLGMNIGNCALCGITVSCNFGVEMNVWMVPQQACLAGRVHGGIAEVCVADRCGECWLSCASMTSAALTCLH